MKIYYAHCFALYNTPQESRDVQTLLDLGFDVVNPNTPECVEGYQRKGMQYFEKFAVECDAVAFRALPDGSISAGVATEIRMFQALLKPIIELPCGRERRELTTDETREYLRDAGAR